jgi:hypothetical protein
MTQPRVTRSELAGLAGILAAGAVLRFVNLAARGGWDSDQGNEMLGAWTALHDGQLPQVGPLSSIGTFHHGALTYDLWIPFVWLGNGDPTFVVAETALGGLLTVLLVWWTARTIGGPAAGLCASFLAAISAALISYSVFIWCPTLLEPGSAIAIFATWEAWRRRDPRWWLLAAVGLAIVMQSHITGSMLALPIVAAGLASVLRAPAGARRRHLAYGLASAGLIAVTYVPLLAYELSHDFAETRAIVAYFGSPETASSLSPPARLLMATVRILAWPLTSWPLIDLRPAFLEAVLAAASVIFGLVWQTLAVKRDLSGQRVPRPGAASREPFSAAPEAALVEPDDAPSMAEHVREPSLADRRDGLALVSLGLAVLIVVPGLALSSVSEVQGLPTEQYHAYADPLALVAAGLVLGAIWQTRRTWRTVRLGRVAVVAALAALLAWNAVRWPPLTAPDGGYPAALEAVTRIENDARGSSIAFISLPPEKGADAYVYPLTVRGAKLSTPPQAATVVVLCDSFWIETGCGDPASEATWLAQASAGTGLQFVERFVEAPYRTLSVYRRAP